MGRTGGKIKVVNERQATNGHETKGKMKVGSINVQLWVCLTSREVKELRQLTEIGFVKRRSN